MAHETIADIRKELSKIKGFKKKVAQKMTAESLATFKGFEHLTIEKRQQLIDAMREFATIAVLQLNRLVTIQNTKQ